MKLEVNKEKLYKAVSTLGKTVSLRPTTPVLGNLLIEADQGGLTITATNLDTTTRSWTAAKVLSKGRTTAPARLLIELLSTLAQTKITLTLEKEILVVKTEKTIAKIPTISAEEFPTLPKIQGNTVNKIKKQKFFQAVQVVGVAASQDEGRPVLTGLFFKPEKDKTLMVATDGYRLAKKEMQKLMTNEVIIPARGLVEAGRMFEESEEDSLSINISQEENQAAFLVERVEYFTKLIAGQFPNFDQIIPTQFITKVVLDKEAFLAALKTASTFAKELGNVVHLSFGEKGSKISAASAQVGEGEVFLDSEIQGQDVKIAFNSRYLADGASSLLGEKIQMQFSGPVSPALIKSPQDDSFIYIAMPVRTQT